MSDQTTETSTDNLVPPGMETHVAPEVDPWVQTAKLATFLETSFPEEIDLSNRQQPETPVDTAIRLLQGFVAKTPPSQVSRCTESYCNRAAGHTDAHGWVQS